MTTQTNNKVFTLVIPFFKWDITVEVDLDEMLGAWRK